MASFRTAITRAVARDKTEGGRTPTISHLLLPKAQRTFPRDTESWLEDHEALVFLESLAAHLIRTLPENVLEETDKWVDMQKGRKGGAAAAVLDTELSDRVDEPAARADGPGVTRERATWVGKRVSVVTVLKEPPKLATSDARAHHHRLACVTATAPFLGNLRHEALLPVYGYVLSNAGTSLLHPVLPPSYRQLLSARRQRRLSAMEVLHLASDASTALGHMHALGFLHRDLSCAAVYPRQLVTELSDGDVLAETPIDEVMIGGYTFTVRTSRGRVTASNWLPAAHAPETVHTRTFDWGTDVYALGMMLLEACYYGDQAAALAAAAQFATRNQSAGGAPPPVPVKLWTRLIGPCLHPAPDARHTILSARREIEDLLIGYQTQPADEVDHVPFATDQVDSATFTALRQAGAPATAIQDKHVSCVGMRASGWAELARALPRNQNLTSFSISDSVGLDLSSVPLHASVHITTLKFSKCQLATGQSWPETLDRWIRPSVQCFELSGVPLLDGGTAEVVALVAERCVALCSLSVATVGAGRETCSALLKARDEGYFRHLAHLELGGNEWPATALAQLCSQWFQRSPTLRHVSFRQCGLDYFTIGNLAQVVKQSAVLESLDLTGVPLSDPSLWLLSSARRANSVSRVKILIDAHLDSSYAEELRAACHSDDQR
jgi:serine/threonine protein kinase